MSEILKTFVDHLIVNRPTWWVILDCGHWYHWTGEKAPNAKGEFPCPSCGTISVEPMAGAEPQKGQP